MADKIQTMIPRYGELNRIYRDYIDNRVFSFDRQKFISDFCQEYNDMKSFEAASFFQIPPRSGHPCFWLYDSRY
ncbi:putative uncharacterized protein [Prevotella sp. CAG:924]|nr:putative uncharacterized protein [Prevotella sp. CAG:924]